MWLFSERNMSKIKNQLSRMPSKSRRSELSDVAVGLIGGAMVSIVVVIDILRDVGKTMVGGSIHKILIVYLEYSELAAPLRDCGQWLWQWLDGRCCLWGIAGPLRSLVVLSSYKQFIPGYQIIFLNMIHSQSTHPHPDRVKESTPLSDTDTTEDSGDEMVLCQHNIWASNPSRLSAEKRKNGNRKLKNELCKNFIRYGCCKYGAKCQFAHGIDQLRKNDNQNSKYKTKRCLTFFRDGCCMYGVRCNFQHHCGPEHSKKESVTISQVYQEYPELLVTNRRRLGFFKSLAEAA